MTTSISAIVKGALKIMAWTKMKSAFVVGASLLLVAGTTVAVLHTHIKRHNQVLGKQSDWQDYGQATPRDAIETYFWAMREGNGPRVGQCLSSLDMGLPDIVERNMTTGPMFAYSRTNWLKNNVSAEIRHSDMPTPDTATFEVRSKTEKGSYMSRSFCLKNEGDKWKILLNIQMQPGRGVTVGYLKPEALPKIQESKTPSSSAAPPRRAQQSVQSPGYSFNFPGIDSQQVLQVYGSVAGLQLETGSFPSASIYLTATNPLTKDEAIKLLEKTLKEQAGLVIKRLNDKQASVTYDPSFRVVPNAQPEIRLTKIITTWVSSNAPPQTNGIP